MWSSKVPRQPRDTCSLYPGGSETKICCSRLPRLRMSLALLLAHGHACRSSHGYYQSGSRTTLRIPDNASTCHSWEVLSELCKDLAPIFSFQAWTQKCVSPGGTGLFSGEPRYTCGPGGTLFMAQDNKGRKTGLGGGGGRRDPHLVQISNKNSCSSADQQRYRACLVYTATTVQYVVLKEEEEREEVEEEEEQ